ncbi:hypothetical protein AB0F96_18925 [Streptomyces sp. NPDC023998]|uniref:hypothetical protein n=1 Tax=Streptomyces sp. NPDC023998 TaxID=3154597 RepID=UPI0033D98121
MADRKDFDRTVALLCGLALYAHTPGHDTEFVATVGPSLAASLPGDVTPDFPPGYDPTDGPDYPEAR